MNWTATSKRLAGLCVLPWLAVPAQAQLAANAYEQPPRVRLSQVLPDTLMRSGVHRVEDSIRVKGALLEFTVDSDHGRYDVLSIPMLILRIHEIRTLAQAVDAYQRDNQQLAARLREIMQVGGNSPVASVGSNLEQLASNNVGQAIKDLGDRSDSKVQGARDADNESGFESSVYESFQPGDPILAAHKRAIALQLDLDVYSSNTRVQAFLNTLARARGGGNRNAGRTTVALPNDPEITVDRGRVAFAVRNALSRKTVRELYIQNEAALQAIGIEPDLYQAFLSHPAFSPRHKTEITAYLVYMNGVVNRGALLRAALRAKDEVSALAYVRMARMLAYYHENTERLQRLVSGGSVLMAVTTGNNMAMVLPFDLLWWNSNTDRVFSSLAEFADQNGFKLRELLLIGITSDTARLQLERRKFSIREKYLLSP
ncbi:MAG: hypothetical protein BMS9Abin14_450 [Gammaproteobacteria bacterium]|nr:MAG: hypothetical protein BMS9Abin14_450 [Gammaproteobacteria bacterium]